MLILDLLGPGPGPSSSSSSLPPIPPEPTWPTSASEAIIQNPSGPPRLLSLTLSDQLVLLQICLAHKSLYRKRRHNTDYWQRVVSRFWDISGWGWTRVRNFVQYNIRRHRANPYRVRDNPEGQMKQLLRELVAGTRCPHRYRQHAGSSDSTPTPTPIPFLAPPAYHPW